MTQLVERNWQTLAACRSADPDCACHEDVGDWSGDSAAQVRRGGVAHAIGCADPNGRRPLAGARRLRGQRTGLGELIWPAHIVRGEQ
jgi:hypothetical protein